MPFHLPEDGCYIIRFDDHDVEDEMYCGEGALETALYRFAQISVSWNAHLFVKILSNSRDAEENYPSLKAQVTLPEIFPSNPSPGAATTYH